MSKSDAEIAREIMYDDKIVPSTSTPKKLNIQTTQNAVILESGGARHQVPTMRAFNILSRELENTKHELRQATTNLKKLTETIKKMDMALNLVEQELSNKADKYDDN